MTSSDGLTWKKLTTEECLKYPKGSIAYGNDLFVLVDNYRIKKSPDGKTWTDVVLDKSDWGAYGYDWSLQKITFGNNLFVAIGSETPYGYNSSVASYFLSSPDGVHWDLAFINAPRQYTDILYVNGQFVAVDKYGNTISSTDGKIWKENHPKMCSNLNALAFGKNQIIAVGNSGGIFSQKSTGQDSTIHHGFNSELNRSSGKLNLTMDSKSVSINGSFMNSKMRLYIQIISISGKRVYSATIQNYSGKATFSTSAFTNGVYILKVNDGKNTFVSPQFVIMR